MSTSTQRSRLEANIAVAARALRRAGDIADELGDPGAQEDCYAIIDHLRAMLESSVNGKRRPRHQLPLFDS